MHLDDAVGPVHSQATHPREGEGPSQRCGGVMQAEAGGSDVFGRQRGAVSQGTGAPLAVGEARKQLRPGATSRNQPAHTLTVTP